MKSILRLIIITLVFTNCASKRYLLHGNSDEKFLVKTIKKAKINGEISTNKPVIVLDGKPYRYYEELKTKRLNISKSDIKKIEILKPEIGIRIYGDYGKAGVILITTESKNEELKTENEATDIYANKNILFLVDGEKVDSDFVKSIDTNTIETIEIIKGESTKKLYPNNNYEGVIMIKMKK